MNLMVHRVLIAFCLAIMLAVMACGSVSVVKGGEKLYQQGGAKLYH